MSGCCGSESRTSTTGELQNTIKATYAAAAGAARSRSAGASCGCSDPVSANLYTRADTEGLPPGAVAASLGCGNPTALAELRQGETVLDLGSGGGIDVLLSARRVGPTGKVYGLDMTDEMLDLAGENQRQAGATNVEFLKGPIEAIPLPDATVDVIISNCVINLSLDKDRVLREAFRVLKPGGRFAVSDIVTRGNIPEYIRQDVALWTGCVAGALDENDYRLRLEGTGFTDVTVTKLRLKPTSAGTCGGPSLLEAGSERHEMAGDLANSVASAFIRARKPLDDR